MATLPAAPPVLSEKTLPPPSRPPWWLWPNVLSLDAPVVAMVWLWLFARSDRLTLGWPFFVALGASVWVIYLLDRLVDGALLGVSLAEKIPVPRTHRHYFAHRHPATILFLIVVGATITGYTILFRLPMSLLLPGLWISTGVWFYIGMSAARIHSWLGVLAIIFMLFAGLSGLVMLERIPRFTGALALLAMAFAIRRNVSWESESSLFVKEVLCGFLFAAGVSFPLFVYSHDGILALFTIPAWIAFGAVCSLNCIAITIRERGENGRRTVSDAGANGFQWACAVVVLLGLVGSSLDPLGRPIYACSIGSVVLLAFLFRHSKKMQASRFRVLADLALLVPPLLWIGASRLLA